MSSHDPKQLTFRRPGPGCSDGACVEVARGVEGAFVRDSKDPDGPVLQFTEVEWRAFVSAVRAGEFD